MRNIFKSILIGLITLALTSSPFAAPVLRDNIVVISPIVTVGDMFNDAGILAEQALFRAPAPGTIGQVSLQSIRVAAAKIGMDTFDNSGFANVSVARKGIQVTLKTFEDLMSEELIANGVLRSGMSISAFLNRELDNIFAEDAPVPVTLQNLRYLPGNNQFSARFLLAGQRNPVDISGRLDFSILAPHLVRSLPAGSILKSDDIELRNISLQFARNVGVPTLEQLIGRQLQRNQLEGAPLRQNDVTETIIIARNQIVTLFLKSGSLTLTVKAQALENASQGDTISVLNLMSNTTVQGIATSAGTVEISATSKRVASL